MKKDFDTLLNAQLGKTTVCFKNIDLSDDQVDKIYFALLLHPEISTLELKNCGLNDQHAEKFFRLTHLIELDLTNNELTNKVAEFCSTNNSLSSLNLSSNDKINNGFFANFNNKSIQTLFLGRTNVCNLEGLQENKSLVNLHLNHTNLKRSSLGEFKNHPTLQFLNLCCAEVKEKSVKNLIQSKFSVLNDIDVSGADLSDKMGDQLDIFVQKNLKTYFFYLCESVIPLNLGLVAHLIGGYLLNSSSVKEEPNKLYRMFNDFFPTLASNSEETNSLNLFPKR